METRSKDRKRKLMECEYLIPFKVPKNLDGLENQENYVTFDYIKCEKNDFFDEIRNDKMKAELKVDTFELKQDFKIGFVFCEFCKKNIKDTNFKNHLAQHNRTEKCNNCLGWFTEIGISRHSCKTLICELCGKNYRNRSKFESHLRHHDLIEERKFLCAYYPCSICNKKIHKHKRKRHALTHTGKSKCSECGLVISKDKLPSHFQTHFKYICDICGKHNSSMENHKRHMRLHEKAKNPCPECDETFQYLVELARHITRAHRQIEDGKYECPFCKKIVSAISHHLRTHEEDPRKCERCAVVLSNYSAYKAHMRFHDILSNKGRDRMITPRPIKNKPEYFSCSLCDKLFPRKIYLIQHFKSHIRFITHPCPLCPANSFISYIDLMKHVSEDHMMLPKGCVNCEICNEVVPNIDKHIKIHQPDRYVCEICSISFETKNLYNKHYTRRHKLRAKGKSQLHVLMEKYATPKSNFKKVACLMCHQKIRISHMRSHISLHQMFKCIMCQKSFSNQKSLELHERLHDKFSQRCPGCSQLFLSHVRLMAHLKMYHKMAFSTSKACPRCEI